MDRKQEILKYVGIGTRGIEVAPWHSPILLPGDRREVIVLDVLDRDTLYARADADPSIAKSMLARIAPVDLVGSACEIAELARARFGADARFDFVISSHNLEHLPDPIRFLQGCESLLEPGGVVSMAVPDKRGCFDYFRPLSTTGDFIQAYLERRERPSFVQTFNQTAYTAGLRSGNGVTGAFSTDDNPGDVALVGDLDQSFKTWLDRIKTGDTDYHDTHCWTFTPSSLELILNELVLLGLLNLEIVSITRPFGCEFFVHLRKRPESTPKPAGLASRREELLQQTIDEQAHMSRLVWQVRTQPWRRVEIAWGRTPIGATRLGRLLRRSHTLLRLRRGMRMRFGI